jgi:hypothetical protein
MGRLKLRFSAEFPWLEDRNCMMQLKSKEAQKAFILKQDEEGAPVAEIRRKRRISQRPTSVVS